VSARPLPSRARQEHPAAVSSPASTVSETCGSLSPGPAACADCSPQRPRCLGAALARRPRALPVSRRSPPTAHTASRPQTLPLHSARTAQSRRRFDQPAPLPTPPGSEQSAPRAATALQVTPPAAVTVLACGAASRLVVGERGFEPPAPTSQTWCSARLSYSPSSVCDAECTRQGRSSSLHQPHPTIPTRRRQAS
jgi:hypothetical protein